MKKTIVLLVAFSSLAACALGTHYTEVLAPETVRLAALNYAKTYAELGAVYEWGGQDPLPRTIKVDCSGLVVRCYGYACEDFGYSLGFADASSSELVNFSEETSPAPGDLILMGDEGVVSHVAIFAEASGGQISFFDATTITGGVTRRSYPTSSPKFISFRRMLVRK